MVNKVGRLFGMLSVRVHRILPILPVALVRIKHLIFPLQHFLEIGFSGLVNPHSFVLYELCYIKGYPHFTIRALEFIFFILF